MLDYLCYALGVGFNLFAPNRAYLRLFCEQLKQDRCTNWEFRHCNTMSRLVPGWLGMFLVRGFKSVHSRHTISTVLSSLSILGFKSVHSCQTISTILSSMSRLGFLAYSRDAHLRTCPKQAWVSGENAVGRVVLCNDTMFLTAT